VARRDERSHVFFVERRDEVDVDRRTRFAREGTGD
jgi:hypothetical protein